MILLEPSGGVANRMRVIASGLWLKKNSNHELAVIWNLNKELNCEFNLLFETIPNVSFVKKKEKYFYLHRSNQLNFYKKIKAYFRNKSLGIDYSITEGDLKDKVFKNKIDQIVRHNKNIHISTTQEFGDNYPEFKNFVPKAIIQKIINQQIALYGENTIGIHIRQTDNFISIAKSPISLFIAKIEEEISKNNETTFFLATDDPGVENVLTNLFGEKMIVYKKELSRDSQKGIIDAVIDMYCLSKTKYIYGSYWSSFSDIAAIIGDIDKITLKED